ncbi:MAG: DUF1223 domain-containing protein [Alphaproteobacteria bacterium]|nr:DUF1223 domain-containing protein [Alphaproteobacteria bacterium]
MWRNLLAIGLIMATLGARAQELRIDAPRRVVELFTSQGCDSCPPADAYLGELTKREGLLALSLHVDYWNHLGWVDLFSSPLYAKRQRDYGQAWRARNVYTPQIVVDGRTGLVGSDRRAIERALETPPAQAGPAMELAKDADGRWWLKLAAASIERPATVWRVIYSPREEVQIARGENAGKKLTYHNVVRSWDAIGRYEGQAIALPLMMDEAQPCALLVQEEGAGAILAALRVSPN